MGKSFYFSQSRGDVRGWKVVDSWEKIASRVRWSQEKIAKSANNLHHFHFTYIHTFNNEFVKLANNLKGIYLVQGFFYKKNVKINK